jgi:DNA-directed RNA polymerase subunit RPC12/RpoP
MLDGKRKAAVCFDSHRAVDKYRCHRCKWVYSCPTFESSPELALVKCPHCAVDADVAVAAEPVAEYVGWCRV